MVYWELVYSESGLVYKMYVYKIFSKSNTLQFIVLCVYEGYLILYIYGMIIHSPVLLKETLSFVPEHAKLIFDGTLGHGGHTLAFLQQFPQAKVIGVDVDEKMLEKAVHRTDGEERFV
jgi:tRNA G46 methylase TrmB